METKNEIGSALQKKLQGVQKSPSPAMWEKINDSLDQRDRRRKRALWLWGAGILLIGLVSLYVATTQNNTQNKVVDTSEIDNNDEDNNVNISTSEMNNTQEIIAEDKENDEKLEKEISEKTVTETSGTIQSQSDNETKISAQNNTVNISEEKAKKSIPMIKKPKERIVDEGFEVTKSYRYYNSKTKEEIITENKKLMDSVIEKNLQLQKSLDSITELTSKIEKDKDSI